MVLNVAVGHDCECAIQIPTARWVSNPTVQRPVAAMATNLGWDTRMFGADAAGA